MTVFRIPLALLVLAASALLPIPGCGRASRPDALAPAPEYGKAYHDLWMGGGAELAGYEIVYPRYGQPRTGTAVTIVVTEPFADSVRVKDETPGRPASDRFPVLKLNLMQDFPTGVYDYNLMTSVFVATAPANGRIAGHPTKVSFSSQEWCGHVYAQARFDRDAVRHESHSYFDGEADQDVALPYPEEGMSEDVLLLWARGLAAPVLEPGASREVRLLRSLETARLLHVPVAWRGATLSRSAETERVRVPAGEFEVDRLTVTVPGTKERRTYPPSGPEITIPALTWTFFVEKASPHRVVRWTRSDGFRASLLASRRMEYWGMSGPRFTEALRDLGLSPRPSRTP